MKVKLFKPALYLDTLRQLRAAGITYIVILEISAILTIISTNIQHFELTTRLQMISVNRQEYTLLNTNPILLFAIIIFSLILVLMTFNYSNKRRSSDVYHALPCTRYAMFLSQFAAVMTWIAAGILISSITSTAGFMLFMPSSVNFIPSSIPITVFYSIAAGLFVSGAAAIAMSVTGTLFTNLVVSALILLAPRLFIAVFTSALNRLITVLPSSALPGFLQSSVNPIFFTFNFRYLVLSNNNSNITLYQLIYTFIIGLIYVAAAMLLFSVRKSETADRSAPNRILQAVFRLSFAMLLCMIPCTTILSQANQQFTTSVSVYFSYVVLYIIAIIGYFLYELVTTRKARNLLRAVPALGILLLLNVAFIGGVKTFQKVIMSDTPEAKDIVGLRFLSLNYNGNFNDSDALSRIEFKEPELNEIVSSSLKESITKTNNNIYNGGSKQFQYSVRIELKGRSLTRLLWTSGEQYNTMFNLMKKNDAFKKAFQALPKPGNVNISINIGGTSSSLGKDELYNILRKEVTTLDFNEWFDYIQNNNYSSGEPSHGNYIMLPSSININNNGQSLYSYRNIPISSLLPKTANYYMSLANQSVSSSTLSNIKSQTAVIINNNPGPFTVYGFGFKSLIDEYEDIRFDVSSTDIEYNTNAVVLLRSIADKFEKSRKSSVDISKPLWIIRDNTTYSYLYVNADSAELPADLPENCQNIYYPSTTQYDDEQNYTYENDTIAYSDETYFY